MADQTSNPPAVAKHCWSCHEAIEPTDTFCRHCGAELRPRASSSATIHVRLVSIEKMLLKTAIGVGLAVILIGWLLLQTYHFGKGGFLGELRMPAFAAALDETQSRTLM